MGHTKKYLKLVVLLILLITSGYLLFSRLSSSESIEIDNNTDIKGDIAVNCDLIEPKVEKVIDSTEISREWYLLDTEYSNLEIVVSNTDLSTQDIVYVKMMYELDSTVGELSYDMVNNQWKTTIDLNTFDADEYTLVIYSEIDGCEYDYYKNIEFTLSYPVYVAWTMDWEGFDVEEKYLTSITNISNTYGIPVTHFFNPYIYINLSDTRSRYLTNWVKDREKQGDSIGLHLHMNDKMVQAAGVKPIDNDWGGWSKAGQDVPNATYGYSDYTQIVQWAIDQFEKNGLVTPTMFRAGGWFADEDNLRVLEDQGFILDSSGRASYTIGDKKVEGPWDLNSTTQPYLLNSKDQNITDNSNTNLLEVPNNGADSWAFSDKQMYGYFKDNYNGGVNNSTKVVTYLSHPHWFNVDEPKMISLFNDISKYSITSDSGPVIFTTLDKLPMLSENE